MSHAAASTTTTLQATPVTTAPENPRLKAFVLSVAKRRGLTEEEVRKRAVKKYGSVERAMQIMEAAEAENKAAIERAFPNGYAGIQVGRKPEPGEDVTFAQLRDDLMVRVWGGDLASCECYCFDFVNRERQYILTPDDVKVYSVATPFSPSAQVLSIEQSLERAKATSLYSDATRRDPNWETGTHHSPYHTAEPPGSFSPHTLANPQRCHSSSPALASVMVSILSRTLVIKYDPTGIMDVPRVAALVGHRGISDKIENRFIFDLKVDAEA